MLQRYSIIVLISLLSMSALISCSVSKNEALSKKEKDMRFNNLLEFHDRSERAFMYHHYCLNDQIISENFMHNFKLTSDLLLDESIDKTKMPPQIIVQRILSRRKMIQQQLSEHYNSLGCQSDEAKMAKTHYDAFSKFSKKQVKSFIEE